MAVPSDGVERAAHDQGRYHELSPGPAEAPPGGSWLTVGPPHGHPCGERKPVTVVVNRHSGGTVVPIGTSLGALGEHERLHASCRRDRSLDVLALLDRHAADHAPTLVLRTGWAQARSPTRRIWGISAETW